jgi:hypothetical protein
LGVLADIVVVLKGHPIEISRAVTPTLLRRPRTISAAAFQLVVTARLVVAVRKLVEGHQVKETNTKPKTRFLIAKAKKHFPAIS